jgi:hypothetical protein
MAEKEVSKRLGSYAWASDGRQLIDEVMWQIGHRAA